MSLEAPLGPGPGRIAARLAKVVELALADVDLSLAQYRALAYLSTGGVAPTALAGQLAVSKPSITALIDGLVARDHVERCPDPDDRRRVEHRLTEAGRNALADADRAVEARLAELLGHLDPAEGASAVAGLEELGRALDAARAAALTR
jgi:long-chain acyl-CoA synthetase